MRMPGKAWKWLGVGLAAAALVLSLVWIWVVPALIVGQIQARVGGKVEIRSWWIDGRSAGLVGLKIHDGPGADAPVWASAERVHTDLTLGGLLRGVFSPRRIRISAPLVALRLDRQGRLLTRIGGKSGGSSATVAVPVVIADGAEVSLSQEGRPAMVVHGVTARLGPDGDKVSLAVQSHDPEWGPFEALGRFDPGFNAGRIDLHSLAAGGIEVTPEKTAAIPFVPEGVWANVALQGKVGLRLTVEVDRKKTDPVAVRTEINLRGTTLRSKTLELTASRTTGRVVVEGALVRFEKVTGSAIDGRVTADGTLDFIREPSRFDLGLVLDRINVADAPRSWQLEEAGVTGHLTGKVRLVAILKKEGVDLSGTSGDAVVEGGTIQGIPFKSIRLVMNARGNDLRYDTPKEKSSTRRHTPGRALWAALVARGLVAFQGQDAAKEKAKDSAKAPARKPGFQLPKSVVTQLELEDVELTQLVARAQFLLGFPFPLPITGRLSIKAEATIPLGQLHSVKDYAFHGDLTLTHASAYKVDLGRVSARVDMADGVLEMKDLRGRLLDRPNGGMDNPPQSVGDDVPKCGPLPPGGFRGTLRAPLSPPGRLTARFEGNDLPLGELAAPALPRPTPLSGLATLSVVASVDLAAAQDPGAWTASGTARSRAIHYRDAELDAVAVTFDLKGGRLEVPELTARLRNRPLSARVGLDLKPPRAFRARLDVTGWDLGEVLQWVPNAPRTAPVAGTITGRADAQGTFTPLTLRTEGQGRFERLQAGPVSLGEVPFGWTTEGDAVAVSVHDARPFGGRVKAEARVPLTAGKPVVGSATVEAIDTARLSASIPGGALALTGKASGKVSFTVPPDVSALDASVRLSAPDLTVQGIPAEQVRATVKAHKGSLGYEVSADSLGGKVSFKGAFPLSAAPSRRKAEGELRAVGFSLGQVWKSQGMTGLISHLRGEGAIDANIRAVLGGPDAGLYAHGVAEFRDLRWGETAALGRLRGVIAATPTVWRIDPIRGDLLDGAVTGFLWGRGSTRRAPGAIGNPAEPARRQLGFDLRVDRVSLRAVLAFLRLHGLAAEGFGTLRIAGTLDDALHATGDVHVARARLAGLPVTDLQLPAEVVTTAGIGTGVVHVRRWSARMAGGVVRGDAWFRFGENRSFRTTIVLHGVDLESIARVESEARRPASGKISGRITLQGPNPALTRRYRGRVSLDLDDASIVALPVFREIDRFLGAASGGLFEDGDLTATIANGQIDVEMLTLVGRLAQLHASGSVGFDGQLDLGVLVNTNQIIAQTGQALVSLIPGLNAVLGRSQEAFARVSGFLSNRLLKFHVTGTLRNPSVALDPSVSVNDSAVSFFSGVFKLPIGQGR